ncbi:hypothetical protein H6P81_010472 [Aristolochia fimbriata]|uniref:FAS1 domain-containing protein n=1 Tax=Aristolochia fimbriata TaxID=158543 RepID=A0AAV7ES96_ARIFI|nr:hypothetical protein H6P81_010472 [Aristolochia fimbriata]
MALAGMPLATVKKILIAHVLLGCYDLKHLATRTHEVILNSFKGFDFTVDPSAYIKQVEVHPGRISIVQVAGVITRTSPPGPQEEGRRRCPRRLLPVDDYDVEEAPTPGVRPSAALAPVTGEASTEAAGSVSPTSANDTASSASRAAVSLLGAALGGFIYQIVALIQIRQTQKKRREK